MKLKLIEIVDSEVALAKLSQIKLPTKIAYRIVRILNKVRSCATIFNDEKFVLVKKYGICTNKETQNYQVKGDNNEIFSEELNKIKDRQTDFPIDKIKIESLELSNIEPSLLVEWLFEE